METKPPDHHRTAAAPAENTQRRLGDYELREEIARGATAVVYKAYQVSLKRYVALKIPHANLFASPAEARRFRREAEAAAHLDHPHIVRLLEVGELDLSPDRKCPFLALQLIDGESLAQQKSRFPRSPKAAAHLLADVARAVHHAHSLGILHRDLKPSNILLDGAGHPWVTDFGLAKRLGDQEGLTQSGAVVGTPGYMAPEQACNPGGITTAADVYSLGAILYELLTGRPPFQTETPLETLEQTQNQEPVRPRLLNPKAPRDLETICLKCLAKEPARRYGSAEALADDLERWLNGEPIHARPVRLRERLWKWARRKPAVAALAAVFLLVTALGLTTAAWQWHRAQSVRRALDMKLYADTLQLVQDKLAAGEAQEAADLLDACPRSLRGWEWYCLNRLLHEQPLTIPTAAGDPRQPQLGHVFFHSLGPHLHSAPPEHSQWNERQLRQMDSVKKEMEREAKEAPLTAEQINQLNAYIKGSIGFDSPEQKQKLAAQREAEIRRVDDFRKIGRVAFSPTGSLVAVILFDRSDPNGTHGRGTYIKVYELPSYLKGERASPRRLYTLSGQGREFEDITFSPDGTRLVASAQVPGFGSPARLEVVFWDPQTGQEAVALQAGESSGGSLLCFSAEGRTLVLCKGREATFWEGGKPDHRELPVWLTLALTLTILASALIGMRRLVRWKRERRLRPAPDLSPGRTEADPGGKPCAPQAKPPVRRKWLIGAGVAAGVLLLSLAGLLVKVKTADGTRAMEGNEPLDCTGADGLTWAEVHQMQRAWAKHLGRQVEETVEVADGVTMKFVLVPPGTFRMGSPAEEAGRHPDETLHRVTLTGAFYLGKTEVTQEQYEALMGTNPSFRKGEYRPRFPPAGSSGSGAVYRMRYPFCKGADLPVEGVTWDEARDFADRLTKKRGDRHVYRLPTEAEWEYSCRGGRSSSQPFGVGDGRFLSSLDANINESPFWAETERDYSLRRRFDSICPVGSYPVPNALGLYDMHGNVAEWCDDCYGPYPQGDVTNPCRPCEDETMNERVVRGGDWSCFAESCRAACRKVVWQRGVRDTGLGFRLARSLPPGGK